jgi:hypothetical protein
MKLVEVADAAGSIHFVNRAQELRRPPAATQPLRVFRPLSGCRRTVRVLLNPRTCEDQGAIG